MQAPATRSSHTTTPERWAEPQIAEWVVKLFGTHAPLGFEAGDENLYRYARNTPTAETDPSGLQVGARSYNPDDYRRWDEERRMGNRYEIYGRFGKWFLGIGGWGDPPGAADAGGGESSHGNGWYYSWVRVTNIGGNHNFCTTSTGGNFPHNAVGAIGLRLPTHVPGTYRVTIEMQGIIQKNRADLAGTFHINVTARRPGLNPIRDITFPGNPTNATSTIEESTFEVTLPTNPPGGTFPVVVILESVISFRGREGDYVEINSYVRITNFQRLQR